MFDHTIDRLLGAADTACMRLEDRLNSIDDWLNNTTERRIERKVNHLYWITLKCYNGPLHTVPRGSPRSHSLAAEVRSELEDIMSDLGIEHFDLDVRDETKMETGYRATWHEYESRLTKLALDIYEDAPGADSGALDGHQWCDEYDVPDDMFAHAVEHLDHYFEYDDDPMSVRRAPGAEIGTVMLG